MKHHTIEQADPELERIGHGNARDVNVACTAWLLKRGLLYDNPKQEMFSENAARANRDRATRAKRHNLREEPTHPTP